MCTIGFVRNLFYFTFCLFMKHADLTPDVASLHYPIRKHVRRLRHRAPLALLSAKDATSHATGRSPQNITDIVAYYCFCYYYC